MNSVFSWQAELRPFGLTRDEFVARKMRSRQIRVLQNNRRVAVFFMLRSSVWRILFRLSSM